jgi:WD40 repeat protein
MFRCFRRRAQIFLTFVTVVVVLAAARLPADEPAGDPKAEAALKALTDRCQDASGDRDKLAQDIQAFRVAYSGTSYAVRAAVLLSTLPSPLDKLDAAAIPDVERFSWQPKELVAVIGEHRGRQGGPVTCVAASADGNLAASGGGSLIRLWKPTEMRLLAVGSHYGVLSIAFSHESTQLVSGGADGYVRLWDIADEGKTMTMRAQVQAATTPISSVAFAPDGKSVAAGCGDNNVKVYEVGEKELKELHVVSDHTQPITGVAYAPDGKTLVSSSSDKTVHLWDVKPDKLETKAVLELPTAGPLSVAVAPTGAALAASCADGTVLLWNFPAASKAKPRTVLPAVAGAVYSVAFSKDGGTLAAACGDGSVRLWPTNGAPMKEKVKFDGHAGAATSVAYGPEDKLLYSGGQDWVVRSWETATKKERFQPFSHLSHVYAAEFSPDGKTLATGAVDRELRLWDLKQTPAKTRNYAPPHPEAPMVYSIAFSPDGKQLVAGGSTTTATLFDAANGRPIRNFSNHPGEVRALTFTPDGKQILDASATVLIVWDAAKGVETNRFKAHETNLGCAALSPDGRFAVSGSGNYLYDKAGKIVLDKDNRYVFTDCVLRLWDMESGKELDTVKAERPFCAAAYTPDGQSLLTCASVPVVQQWDARKPPLKETSKLTGAANYSAGMVFSPDGRTMCTSVLDGKLIVWDTASGMRLKEWVINENVGGIGYSPDSRHLAVGLGTGVVYILRLAGPGNAAP